MNPARIRAALVPSSVREIEGGRLEEHRALEDEGQRVTKEVRLTLADGLERRWREDVRLYEHAKMAGMLAERGFEVVNLQGDFGDVPFAEDSPRQLVTVKRR